MATLILSFTGIGLVIMFGYILSRILLPKSGFAEHFSLGFILGWGIFTFLWFLLNCIGIPFNPLSGILLSFSLFLFVLLAERIFFKKNIAKNRKVFDLSYFKNMTAFEKIMAAVIAFFCIATLIQTIYWPVRYWDSLVLYDFRAKVFSQTGFMLPAIARGYFFVYPLFTTLAHTWIYVLGLNNPLFFYSLLYIFLIVSIFENVKKFNIGRTMALFITTLVTVSPRLFDHTLWAYTNLPFTIFIVLGSIYLYWGIINKNLGSFIASAILIGLSTWTRSTEPFLLSCLIVAVVASLFQKKWFWPPIYGAILAAFIFPWKHFRAINESQTVNVSKDLVSTSEAAVRNFLDFSLLRSVINYVMTNVVFMYLGFFIIFAFIILVKLYKKSKNWIFVILIFLNLGITFAGTLVFATSYAHWHDIPDSLSRMVMFIPPMIIFLCAEFFAELKNKNGKKSR